MAYLWKHTPLQTTFPVNMTCLVPTENPEVGRPERLDLHQMLWYFLKFRLDVVTARLEHELGALQEAHPHPGRLREGLRRARRDPADRPQVGRQGRRGREDHRAIRPRRRADRRDPRAEDLSARAARDPRHHQRARREAQPREQIGGLLEERSRIAGTLVRDEIAAVQKQYADPKKDPRRTELASDEGEVEYSADDFIVEEDNVVIVSRDGWVKRQKEVKDLASTRLREGDAVLAVLPGSTRATAVFFSNFGTAYTCRIVDVPASTGYGEPIQKLFKFKDGERIVGALSLDPARREAHQAGEGGRGAAGARAGGDERRLQPAVRPRRVRRAEHARRPALRARRRRRRSRRRREDRRQRDRHRRDAVSARDAVQGRGDQLPVGTGPRRHPDQAAPRRTTRCWASSRRSATATC